jgi:hypothetical protein
MAIGPEWAGVAGAAVGGALGIVGTLVSQMRESSSRREERRAQFAREDHLRQIEVRRELYSECLTAVNSAYDAVRPAGDDAESSTVRVVDVGHVNAAIDQSLALESRLALAAPKSVTEPLHAIATLLRQVKYDDGERVLANTLDLWELEHRATESMRADLRIVDTHSPSKEQKRSRSRKRTNYQLGDR